MPMWITERKAFVRFDITLVTSHWKRTKRRSVSFFVRMWNFFYFFLQETILGDLRSIRLSVSRPFFKMSFTIALFLTSSCSVLSFEQPAQGQSPSVEKCYWNVCVTVGKCICPLLRLTILPDLYRLSLPWGFMLWKCISRTLCSDQTYQNLENIR